LNLKHPIVDGIIVDWDNMEKLWQHVFQNELRVNPAEQPILLTESPLNSKENRRQTTQIMFETFQVPSLYLNMQALFSLYASNQTTGLVVDSGDSISYAVPVVEGDVITSAIRSTNVAGAEIANFYLQCLYRQGFNDYRTTQEEQIVEEFKKRYSFVSLDFPTDLNTSTTSTTFQQQYELPDSQMLTVNSERFQSSEMLFQPHEGIGDMVIQSLSQCENSEQQHVLSQQILLAGGTSLLPGLAERLQVEVTKGLSSNAPASLSSFAVEVLAPPDRAYSAWLGAAMLASLTRFSTELAVSKSEYLEYGDSIVFQKFM
jgi:actin-related protein